MDRQQSLTSLEQLREQIITVYECSHLCQSYQNEIESLEAESKNPPPMFFRKEKPANTHTGLEKKFREENRKKLEKPAIWHILVLIACGLGLAALAAQLIWKMFAMAPEAEFASEGWWFMIIASACPVAFAVLSVMVSAIADELNGAFALLAIFAVSGLATWGLSNAVEVGYVAYLMIALAVVGIVTKIVESKIRDKAYEKGALTPEQEAKVAQAKKEYDAAMGVYNEAYAEAQGRYEEDLKVRRGQIKEELVKWGGKLKEAAADLKQEMDKLTAMDVLGEDEKDLKTVDILIGLLKSRRADNIKEALHEFDKIVANEQLMAVEQQRLQAELERVAVEKQRAAEQARANAKAQKEMEDHNMMMRIYEQDSARRKAEMQRQLDHIGYMIHDDIYYRR